MYYVFGDYVLDTQRYELHHAGEPIKLRRKVFQVLAYLLVHRERVVPKEELLEHLWPDQFVGDAALKSCITALRKALGEGPPLSWRPSADAVAPGGADAALRAYAAWPRLSFCDGS